MQLDWYARNNEADATPASEVERRACQLYPANAELAYVDWFMDDRSVIALSKEMKDLPDRKLVVSSSGNPICCPARCTLYNVHVLCPGPAD